LTQPSETGDGGADLDRRWSGLEKMDGKVHAVR